MTTVTFEGGKELAATLAALPTSVSKAIQRDALSEAAEPMVAVARRLAPRRSPAPDIADNIEIGLSSKTDSFGDAYTRVAWGPVKGFFYGKFLEYGTVRMSARTFMRPAFDANTDRAMTVLTQRLWEHIQSYALARNVR